MYPSVSDLAYRADIVGHIFLYIKNVCIFQMISFHDVPSACTNHFVFDPFMVRLGTGFMPYAADRW